MTKKLGVRGLKWLVFGTASFYYLFEYIERISPAVMVDEIMQSFNINALLAGNLSAIYFYIYAIMQVPVGILIDRFGPKNPLFLAASACSLGSVLFSYAPTLFTAEIGRILIGFGSSFGYLSCLKLVSNWFESREFAFMCGLVNMIGMLGAFFGERLLSALMSLVTWREIMFYLSFFGVLAAIFILLFIKDKPKGVKGNEDKIIPAPIGKTLKRVFFSPQILLAGVYVGVIYCTFDMLAAMWGIPYLQHIYDLTNYEAAKINSLIFLGAIIGYPLFGAITSYFKHAHKKIMIIATFMILLVALWIASVPDTLLLVKILFIMLGVLCGVTSTATTLAKENMPIAINGACMSVVNVLLVSIAGLSQPLFGYLLDIDAAIDIHSLKGLTQTDFSHAFMLLPTLYFIGLITTIFIKQTKSQQV